MRCESACINRRQAMLGAGALILSASADAAKRPHVRVAASGSYAPYNYFGPDGQLIGMLVDAMALIAPLANAEFEFVDVPWVRGQQMVRSGQLDAFCTTRTRDREAYVDFAPTPLFEEGAVLLYRADDLRAEAVNRIEDLRDFKVGEPFGSGWMREQLDSMNIVHAPDIANLLTMIAARRLDLSVVTIHEAKIALSDSPVAASLKLRDFPAIRSIAFHVGLRKGFPGGGELIGRIDGAIKQIKANGSLHAVVNRYS